MTRMYFNIDRFCFFVFVCLLAFILSTVFADCQCNGHSKCINKNICYKCDHQTDGEYVAETMNCRGPICYA